MKLLKKHFQLLLAGLMVACVPVSVWAQSSNQNLANEIIETLALSHKVTQPPADFSKQFEQNPFRLSEKVNQRWLGLFKDAYSKKQLMQDYRAAFEAELSRLPADELSAWLSRAGTQKLAEARKEYYSLQGKRKRIVAQYELEKNPLPKERQELIASYAEAVIPKGAITEASVAVMQSIIKTIDQVSTKLSFTDAQINMIVSNVRMQAPQRIKQLKEKKLPVKFYNVPSPTIEKSLQFWQTETGQALAKAIYTSLQKTYEKAGQRLDEAVSATK